VYYTTASGQPYSLADRKLGKFNKTVKIPPLIKITIFFESLVIGDTVPPPAIA
jgi:hypothetical protein